MNAEARKMSPFVGGTLLTGVVVSELQDGSIGRVSSGEGGRPARAVLRVQDWRGGYTRKASARRASGEESDLRGGTAEGGSDVTGTYTRWLSGSKHMDDNR
jgi:hypothetical protein